MGRRLRTENRAKLGDDRAADVEATLSRLEHHRVFKVKKAARTAHLARGFLRGIPYARMEATMATRPEFEEVEKEARRFGTSGETQNSAFQRWLEPALRHFKEQREIRAAKHTAKAD